MKPDIWEKVNRLSGVTFYCSWDKRFVNIMTSLGPEAALTETQEKWVKVLYFKYRRQLRHGELGVGLTPQELHEQTVEERKLERWVKAVVGG